jgi:membrane fusion protein, multidrug efflux system
MLRKKWIIFIPIIIAIAVLIVLKQNKKEPIRDQVQERTTHVRVISVPNIAIIPQVTGYGTVQPASNWRAISQVKGKVIFKNTKLKKGSILTADQILIKIDPTDYQLSISQTNADIAAVEAQLSELIIKEENTRLGLKIEKKSLKLLSKELQRQKKVAKKGGVSFSDVEKQERSYLGQQQVVQNQHNTLNLLPSQKALLDAQLLRLQSQMQSLQRDLANTEITLPFSGRVAEVNIEENQYIGEGELLLSVDSLDKVEIEVQLPLSDLRSIMYSDKVLNDILDRDRKGEHVHSHIKAQVQLKMGEEILFWKAKFARLSDSLDPKTRTVGAIVEVDNPYANVQPGVRPPLIKGLFVAVKLTGKSLQNSIVVPNSALHSFPSAELSKQKLVEQNMTGKTIRAVYIVDKQGRLEIRPVAIKISQDEYTILNKKIDGIGIEAGEQLVISELLPAIKNMRLSTEEDQVLSQQIMQQATNSHD